MDRFELAMDILDQLHKLTDGAPGEQGHASARLYDGDGDMVGVVHYLIPFLQAVLDTHMWQIDVHVDGGSQPIDIADIRSAHVYLD